MRKLIKICLSLSIFQSIILYPSLLLAGYMGPITVVQGKWGKNQGEFGINYGDNCDAFPSLEAITSDGKIIIRDSVNNKDMIFGLDGAFIKENKWELKSKNTQGEIFIIPEYEFYKFFGTKLLRFTSTGNIFVYDGEFKLISSKGKIIKKYSNIQFKERVIEKIAIAKDTYKVTVKYPDKKWIIKTKGFCPNYRIDVNENIYCLGNEQIVRYDDKGIEIAQLTMPDDKYDIYSFNIPGAEDIYNVIEEYGLPVLGPNGDIYTWKRTQDNYSIIKWIYIDLDTPISPNVLKQLNKKYLRILRNEIFARKGRIFKSKDLQEIFSKQLWYKPDPDYNDKKLSALDRENISLILKFEKSDRE